jgi:hypothetical protein
MAKIYFLIACSLSAIAVCLKEKKQIFHTYPNMLKAATAAGKKWKEQVRDCLKQNLSTRIRSRKSPTSSWTSRGWICYADHAAMI